MTTKQIILQSVFALLVAALVLFVAGRAADILIAVLTVERTTTTEPDSPPVSVPYSAPQPPAARDYSLTQWMADQQRIKDQEALNQRVRDLEQRQCELLPRSERPYFCQP